MLRTQKILDALRDQPGVRLEDLPTASGIYALRDHLGEVRYIGIAHSEGFRVRIRNKHATGSEDRSHKFSAAYNTGRLWRDRHDDSSGDGSYSKKLRNRFILDHCTASTFRMEYSSKADLIGIEDEVIALAKSEETVWNRKFEANDEPSQLVDKLIAKLGLGAIEMAAIERQLDRYREFRK